MMFLLVTAPAAAEYVHVLYTCDERHTTKCNPKCYPYVLLKHCV